MQKHEIQVGETYYFVGSDSHARSHLAGESFTVVRKERVFRKRSYKRGKPGGLVKVLRFFNEDGVGARAEELEPLPSKGFFRCVNPDCGKWSRVQDLHVEPGKEEIHNFCPECGTTAQIFDAKKFDKAIRNEWVEATTPPAIEGYYNVVTENNRLLIGLYEYTGWDIDIDLMDKVVRYCPDTYVAKNSSITPEKYNYANAERYD